MTSPPGQPGQHIAAEMEGDNPVRGYHSRLYLPFPHFLVAPGTVVTAPDRNEVTTRIHVHTAEPAIAARTRFAADQALQAPPPPGHSHD